MTLLQHKVNRQKEHWREKCQSTCPLQQVPHQSCTQHRENSHDSTLQQAPHSHCHNCGDFPNILITHHPGLDLFRTVRPGEYKETGKRKDVDRASDMSLVGHRQLTQLAVLERTAALFSMGPHLHTGKQLA